MKGKYCLVLVLIILLAAVAPVSAVEFDKKTNVSLDKIWVVKFNEKPDEDTINTENIFIKDSKGDKVEIYFNIDEENDREVYLIAKNRYNSGERYCIHINEEIKSVDGRYLNEAVKMEFVTSDINHSPVVIKEIEDKTLTKGEVITIDLSEIFSDEDGDLLTYAVSHGELYGSIFRYTVGNIDEPVHITIGASDGQMIVYESFNVILNKQIDFKDNNIENAIREIIDKPSGYIYSEDVKDITKLSLNKKEISSLEGLQHLIGLKELKLALNQIANIKPLSNLKNLETLDLKGSGITDISSLAGLTNLECLYLSYNRIVDITALKNLTKLKELDLSYNQIKDVSPLSKLTNLEVLEIIENPIEDYSPIEHLFQ